MGLFPSQQEKTEVGEKTWVLWKLDTLPGRCRPALAVLKLAPDLGACSCVSGPGAFAQRSLPFYSPGAFEEFAKEIKGFQRKFSSRDAPALLARIHRAQVLSLRSFGEGWWGPGTTSFLI